MKYEMEVYLEKGDGRNGLGDKINLYLMTIRAILKTGTYKVTIERIKTKETKPC